MTQSPGPTPGSPDQPQGGAEGHDPSASPAAGDNAAPVSDDPQAIVDGEAGQVPIESVTVDEDVAASQVEDDLSRTRRQVDELTGDLQRLQAEFLNYKRRVERDRDLLRENATYAVLVPIIEVLDTIDRAREHGPLEDGLRAVADQLERVVAGLGLTRFGAVGDAFDPNLHEALSHIGTDPDVAVTTAKVVAKSGYRINDRVVRAAQVLVVDPAEAPADQAPGDAQQQESAQQQ